LVTPQLSAGPLGLLLKITEGTLMSRLNITIFFIFILSAFSLAQQNDTTQSSDKDSMVVEPKVLHREALEFPPLAQEASLEANIFIKVAVGKDGIPYKTVIFKREPEFVYMFDEDVRKNAMKWRFSPALNKQNEPVAVWISIPFRFRMREYQSAIVLEQAKPEYPKEALEMGMESWVGVAVLVKKEGYTIGSKIIIVSREHPYTKVFDDAAIEAARNSSFKPATYQGTNTDGWAFLKIEFKIHQK
jgi:TonB family protein